MGVDETNVDLLSLDAFARQLQGRLDEALTAVAALGTDLRSDPVRAKPALGDFQDARETADRYEAVRTEYLARLNRLVDAVLTAQATTATVLTTYRTNEALHDAGTRDIRDLLTPGS